MRRLWRRAWSILSGRDRKIRRRLGLLAVSGLVVGLTGCVHYVHEPPVTLAQHRIDLHERQIARHVHAHGSAFEPAREAR